MLSLLAAGNVYHVPTVQLARLHVVHRMVSKLYHRPVCIQDSHGRFLPEHVGTILRTVCRTLRPRADLRRLYCLVLLHRGCGCGADLPEELLQAVLAFTG